MKTTTYSVQEALGSYEEVGAWLAQWARDKDVGAALTHRSDGQLHARITVGDRIGAGSGFIGYIIVDERTPPEHVLHRLELDRDGRDEE